MKSSNYLMFVVSLVGCIILLSACSTLQEDERTDSIHVSLSENTEDSFDDSIETNATSPTESADDVNQNNQSVDEHKMILQIDSANGESLEIDLALPINGEVFPNYFIEDLNADELSLLRNAYFAKHGYVFQNQKYNDYFSDFDWYTPNKTIKDFYSMLNDTDLNNVNLIKKLEEFYSVDGEYEIVVEDCGIKFAVPNSWKDKIRIDKFVHGIYIKFIPDQITLEGSDFEYIGDIFALWDEEFYIEIWGSIGNGQYVETKTNKYIITGPTDTGFAQNHPEYLVYLKMNSQLSDVVKSIKRID